MKKTYSVTWWLSPSKRLKNRVTKGLPIFVKITDGLRCGSIGIIDSGCFKIIDDTLMVQETGRLKITFDGKGPVYHVNADGYAPHALTLLSSASTCHYQKIEREKAPSTCVDRHGNTLIKGDAIIAATPDGIVMGIIDRIGVTHLRIRSKDRIRAVQMVHHEKLDGFNFVKLSKNMYDGFLMEKLSS